MSFDASERQPNLIIQSPVLNIPDNQEVTSG